MFLFNKKGASLFAIVNMCASLSKSKLCSIGAQSCVLFAWITDFPENLTFIWPWNDLERHIWPWHDLLLFQYKLRVLYNTHTNFYWNLFNNKKVMTFYIWHVFFKKCLNIDSIYDIKKGSNGHEYLKVLSVLCFQNYLRCGAGASNTQDGAGHQ